jgi:WD40 repeat protein
MASPLASSRVRFNNYLDSLRDELEQSNPSKNRFNIYLRGLSSEFELIALELESLQNEHTSPFFSNLLESRDLTQETTPSALTRPITVPVPLPSQPYVADPHPAITFNNERQLDVQLAHTLYHKRSICCVNFSRDGKYLASGCVDGKAYIYDVQSATLTSQVFRNHPCYILTPIQCFQKFACGIPIYHSCVLHARSKISRYRINRWRGLCEPRLLYASPSPTYFDLQIWEINTKRVQKGFKAHTSSILSLHFSPDDRFLVSVSKDNTVRVWNMRCGAARVLIDDDPAFTDDWSTTYNPPNYTTAAFSPDGRYIAASHMDGLVRLWDVRTAQLMRRVDAHMNWVYHVAFMPDGNGLITGSRDKTLRYWDVGSLGATRLRPQREVEEQTQPEREFLGHQVRFFLLCATPSFIFYRVLFTALPSRLMPDGLPRARPMIVAVSGTLAVRRSNASSIINIG